MPDLAARIKRMQASQVALEALVQSYRISYRLPDLRSAFDGVWAVQESFVEVPIDLLLMHRSLVENPRPEGRANW
jgi:hypothetical protein